MYGARQQAFEAWYDVYGTPAKKGRYFQALRDPHYVLNDRATNPVPGLHQHINATLFPQASIYEWTDRDRIKALFLEATKDKVADDGSMHTAIGNYALWLRMTSEDACWVNEPLWDGDDVPADSGAKSRIKTLNANGFDYLSVLKKHKETYMFNKYLAAIRTKPFILLAGISGTGKSRLVRQLARGCCPSGHEFGKDAEGNADAAQKPGNFEIIPVRPNWHDSTELMGYVTRITASNKPEFVIKPFVRFLAKAMVYKDVPFFLCLDEMNLAPVEQYFAEYLSAVETRKKTANGIVSDVLVNFDLPEIDVKATVNALMKDWVAVAADGTVTEKVPNAKAVYDAIVADKGLRIPSNLVVMGTVNMDETTCSFSRKVLDRAMTFELNEVNMDEGLASDNSISYGSIPAAQAFATDVDGCDFYTANQTLCDTVKTYLRSVNAVLEDTPFKFAYRSRNEIMLYCIERTRGGVVSLVRALDEATSMKILSRIEGDDQKLLYVGDNPAYKDKTILDALKGEIAAALKVVNGGTDPADCTVCAKKLDFMARRLGGGFTNFFV